MRLLLAASLGLVTAASAQTPTCHGNPIAGTVHDSTQALIPNATIVLDKGRLDPSETTQSGADGRFRLPCVALGAHQLTISADGFADRTLPVTLPRATALDVLLDLQTVDTAVDVNAQDAPKSTNSTGPGIEISGSRLAELADDPDDLTRQLQQLAATGGGNPLNTVFAVDGFQGSTALPPKSSIASIRVNPDQFSAEYREPPFGDGRVEITTKPGAKAYHGALFLTNGSPFENARDPFSTSKAALGKQRYGFELNGPVRKAGSDFALTLEHRAIDDFAVVNAVTLDSNGNGVSTVANVATPQRLWLGTARIDWQLGAKNIAMASYSANVNNLQNVGVGGVTLAESGYNSEKYEHMIRFSDITTISPKLINEARLSLRWDGENDLPSSTAPQIQVAGSFTGGGNTFGAQQLHELNTEIDEDMILTLKKHSLKYGAYLMIYKEHQLLTTNFNGTYIFGGGTAPVLGANNQATGQTETITGIEQYRRAQLGLAGGTPTAFSNVAGTPLVTFTQQQDSFFAQDDWNVGHGFHVAYGMRYFVESNPHFTNAATPRLGVLWSSKKAEWTAHGHIGLFSDVFGAKTQAEVLREDGVNRVTSTVYNPVFGDPLAGAIPIHSQRTENPHLANAAWMLYNVGGTHTFPHGFNLQSDFYAGRIWNAARTLNVNSPLNGSPTGPRTGALNTNVFEVQNSAQGRINAIFVGVENHALKRVQFFFGGVRVNIIDDNDDSELFSPQSSFSNAGEFARRDMQGTWQTFGNATLKLPEKVSLSTDFYAFGEQHYNITTGFDNNGDGNFNDRPQYAAPGTPGAIQTRYGLLTSSGGTGVLPRDLGVLPWNIHLDMNLQRTFALTRNPKAEHQQSLGVNVRSSNVLNHTNVTTVGGVLGSPLFGVPFAADNGRRIEAGLRYSF